MNKFLNVLPLSGLLFFVAFVAPARSMQFDKLPLSISGMLNVTQQPYIKNVVNITTPADLEDYFAAQITIYIDNSYNVCQRFFYKLLSVLPRSRRFTELQMLAAAMDEFLQVDDVETKLRLFDRFFENHAEMLKHVLEYDAADTSLTVAEFHSIYVGNGADHVLNFIHQWELRAFMESTSQGMRYFLLVNRPIISKAKLLEFKLAVTALLQATDLQQKRHCLNMIISCSKKLYESPKLKVNE